MCSISVVICTYNKKERLILTLKSYEFIYDNITKDFEVIICNDGGDNIENYIDTYNFKLRIRVINLNHMGRSNARNQGGLAANGKVIIFNDDDVIINPECFLFHIKIHEKEKKAVVLGKYKQVYFTEEEIRNKCNIPFYINDYNDISREDIHETCTKNIIFSNKQHSCHWFCGTSGNLSLTKSIFVTSEGFDMNFKGWGYEDIEFSYRLYKDFCTFYCDINNSNYHIDHFRDKKNLIEDIKRNILYFYNKHFQSNDITLYWDFLIGKISLNEFDCKTLNELDNKLGQNVFYFGLKRSNLESINNMIYKLD